MSIYHILLSLDVEYVTCCVCCFYSHFDLFELSPIHLYISSNFCVVFQHRFFLGLTSAAPNFIGGSSSPTPC